MSFKVGDHVVVVRVQPEGYYWPAELARYIGMCGVVDSELLRAHGRAFESHKVNMEDGATVYFVPLALRKLAPPGQQDWLKLCELNPLEVIA